ncbi:hypothetical protein PAXRUDRAFT_826888 [Paxillus rubicundulus Ve08.2h10]|uniref:Uncharacterized protein n=1 Tax=Paxillus rubicundulus Ve08.2h10 TaxID=930991 RepID=A0A0D0DYY5_9AGAM|nr:hypothetical protein PAXRUDRAFT_826888 [Paxillus rubicundulus Ve08.2h10]
MPKAFCIAQTFIIYYAAWSLTGVCAAFTFATTGSVLWPSSMIRTTASTLAWDDRYYFPVLIFPLSCLSISVPVLLRLDAIQPTDDLHCDASRPIWGRFLGYAGFSMLPTIPCFFLSAAAVYRVLQIHINNQRSQVFLDYGTTRSYSRSQFSSDRHATALEVTSPIASPVTATTAPLDLETPYISDSQKGVLPRLVINEELFEHVDDMHEVEGPSPRVLPSPVFASPSSHQKSPTRWEATATTPNFDDEFSPRRQTTSIPTFGTRVATVRPLKPNLTPAIWRLILFQMAFFIIQCLAALSTIIDVAKHRVTPTPFGTQHIALVLVGWGPAVVFGHLPAVRQHLMFWRR